MIFRSLPESLRPVAIAAAKHLRADRGTKAFKVEESIHADTDRPTLHVETRDHHLLCVEPCEGPEFPIHVERFVNDCTRLVLPVRLFVAIAREPEGRLLTRAASTGVGVLHCVDARVTVRVEPLSLGLVGLRPVERNRFPPKYRQELASAESTFRHGDPAKGCAGIYDEIEALTRRIAEKSYRNGMWTKNNPTTKPSGIDFAKESWATIAKTLERQLDQGKCAGLPEPLLARLVGVTPHRNAVGHKVKDRKSLIQRDKALRTRFEDSVDLLAELIAGSRSLKP